MCFPSGPKDAKALLFDARCDDVEVRSIGIHNADLRSSVDGIHRFLAARLKVEKRGEDPDTDNDLLCRRATSPAQESSPSAPGSSAPVCPHPQ